MKTKPSDKKNVFILITLALCMAAACDTPTLKKADSANAINPGLGVNDFVSIEINGVNWSGMTDLSSKRFAIVNVGP